VQRVSLDPVTRVVEWGLTLSLLTHVEAAIISHAVSLLLIGIMAVSSVRGFIVQASRVAIRIERLQQQQRERARVRAPKGSSQDHGDVGAARTIGAASGDGGELADLLGCVTAALMGFYLLSSVLMMRSSLPQSYRHGISEAAGKLEFDFFHHFFDALWLGSFLAAALTTLVRESLACAAPRPTPHAPGQRRDEAYSTPTTPPLFPSPTFSSTLVQPGRYRRRAARRSAGGVQHAVADQLAGVRRHHHAVQAAAARRRAEGTAAEMDDPLRSPSVPTPSPTKATPFTSPAAGGGRRAASCAHVAADAPRREEAVDTVAAQAATAAHVAAQAAAAAEVGRDALLELAAARLWRSLDDQDLLHDKED
jgi:hypothetical protein